MKTYLVHVIVKVADDTFAPENLASHLALPDGVVASVINTVECAEEIVHVATVQADNKTIVRIHEKHSAGKPNGMSIGRYSIAQERFV